MEVSRGRQPIGVNQPPNSGTNYPFIRPSSDVQHLLGDFYLSYKETSTCYAYPFKISWLYGFGDETPSSPSGYTPVHDHDIEIQDASGNVVFNSATTSATYREFLWGDRFLILEWHFASDNKIICRATKFLGWDSYSTDAQGYGEDFVPANGELDPRTCNQLPKRLESISYGLEKFQANVEFAEGNNVTLAVNPEQIDLADLDLEDFGVTTEGLVSAGKRLTNRINIGSEPGAGLGVRVQCDEQRLPDVRRIGGSAGNDWQNMNLDTGVDCIRSQRPIGLTSHFPRRFQYAWLTPPHDGALPQNAYELLNDCATCCDCDYFARTYQGLKRQWFGYQEIATNALEARDTHQDNITRWNLAKECREGDPLRLVTLIQPDCKSEFAFTFGNTSECCLLNVRVRLTLDYSGNDEDISILDCNQTRRDQPPDPGVPYEGPEDYQLVGSFPVYDIIFNYLSPSDIGRVAFKLCKPGCSATDTVQWQTHVTWQEALLTAEGESCTYPEVEISADLQDIWNTAGAPALPGAQKWHFTKQSIKRTLNPNNAYCESCICDESVG